MKFLKLTTLLLLFLGRLAWAQTDSGHLLKLLEKAEEIDGYSTMTWRLKLNSPQPYWRILHGFNNASSRTSKETLEVVVVRHHYAVLVTNWLDWLPDQDFEGDPAYEAIRSRAHILLISRGTEGTVAFLTEEVEVRPEGEHWQSPPAKFPGENRLKDLAAYALLLNRYSADPQVAAAVMNEPPATAGELPAPDQVEPPEGHFLVPDAEGNIPEPDLNFEEELGYLKHLYWTGSLSKPEYQALEQELTRVVSRDV